MLSLATRARIVINASEIMKAIVVNEFGAPEVMKLEDVATPSPGSTQVLVKVMAAGVNPVDTYIRSGNHAQAPKVPFAPAVPGNDLKEPSDCGTSAST